MGDLMRLLRDQFMMSEAGGATVQSSGFGRCHGGFHDKAKRILPAPIP